MKDIDLNKLKELSERVNYGGFTVGDSGYSVESSSGYFADCLGMEEASFIYAANPAVVIALIEQLEALKAKTSMTMGVGMGDGNLFVHGDYESIKAVQGIVFRMEAAEAQVKELTADLDKESEIRHRIHEELIKLKDKQKLLRVKGDIKTDGFWGRMAAKESVRANKAEARIAEQSAVIDQRNAECVRLINEKATIKAELYTVKRERDELSHMDYLTWHAIACKYRTERDAALDEVKRRNAAVPEKAILADHKFRECVNGLLEEAIAYSGTQQLRSRISSRLSNFVMSARAAGLEVKS